MNESDDVRHFNLVLAVSVGVIGSALVALLISLVAVVVFLIKARSKVQDELQRLKASAIYDEIETPPSVIDSSKNVAYASTLKKTEITTLT